MEVVIKPFTMEYVSERYLHWVTEAESAGQISNIGSPINVEELTEYVSSKLIKKDCEFFAITNEFGEHIGNVKFEPIDVKANKCRVGILIGDKGYRGKGLLKPILDQSIALLRDKYTGIKIDLTVKKVNYRAIKAYRKYGFEIMSDFGVDAFLMELK